MNFEPLVCSSTNSCQNLPQGSTVSTFFGIEYVNSSKLFEGKISLATRTEDGLNVTISNTVVTKLFSIIPDTDNDGIPNGIDQNDDGDLYADIIDFCSTTYGTSYSDVYGCIDSDGDGWSNLGDAFPFIKSQQKDSDSDGYGDNTLSLIHI